MQKVFTLLTLFGKVAWKLQTPTYVVCWWFLYFNESLKG